MFVRLYHSNYVGAGTFEDPRRLAMCMVAPAARFDAVQDTDAGIAWVVAPAEVHDLLYADRIANPGRIAYLTPLVSIAIFRTALDKPLRDLPAGFRTVMRNRLLSWGFDLSSVSLDWTLRRTLRAIDEVLFRRQRRRSNHREDTIPAARTIVEGEVI